MKKETASKKIKPFRHLLGTMSDMAVGRVIGISSTAVFAERKRLGIPAFDFRKSEAYRTPPAPMPDKKCACGAKATTRFQKKNVCNSCLTGGYVRKRVGDFVYSGRSCTAVD